MGFGSFLKKAAGTVADAFTGGQASSWLGLDSYLPSGASSYIFNTASAVGKSIIERNWAKQDASTQWNRDLAMWNMTNAYNSPAEQMARLKAAGLNPNLVYGSGNVTGNTASGVSAGSIRGTKMSDFANSILTAQQMQLNDSTVGNIRAEQKAREAAAANSLVDAATKSWNLKLAKQYQVPTNASGDLINNWRFIRGAYNEFRDTIRRDERKARGTNKSSFFNIGSRLRSFFN